MPLAADRWPGGARAAVSVTFDNLGGVSALTPSTKNIARLRAPASSSRTIGSAVVTER
jgi:hypothetical protein